MSFDREGQSQQSSAGVIIAAPYRMARMVVIALGLSIVIYTVIGVVIARVSGGPPRLPQLRIQLLVVALFLALGSVVIRRGQFRLARLQDVTTLRGTEGLLRHLVTTTIISATIAEVIGVLGIVVVFFGGNEFDVVAFGVVGLIIMLSIYPRRRAWERTVEYLASTTGAGAAPQ
ncbi:MAG TPA: hypothetical protein VJH03_13450 [Blastocatellia bacterium]|nr:hypothetical protein [Blastocatellia bacterium]